MQDQLTTIANDLGIADLPVGEQEALIAQFGEVALKASTLALVEKLDVGKREEFIKLSEAGEPEALKAFLDREVPDHETLVRDAVAGEAGRFKQLVA